MLAEGALPEPCLIVADRLVIALPLGTPVGNAGDVADDELSCGKGRGGQGRKEENGEQAKRTGGVTPSH